MSTTKARIYWANAMFSRSDRDFNLSCAEQLRNLGYEVFLPQESSVNDGTSPSSTDIFTKDSVEILNSQVVVACLDQETIDAGVACEIGFSYANGIPVIGLYTDIRQFRLGISRMYKNLYVIGAIELLGGIVTSLGELEVALDKLLSYSNNNISVLDAEKNPFSLNANRYTEYIQELEGSYVPKWNARDVVNRWLQESQPRRILDFGCGTGELLKYISNEYADIECCGYDIAEPMIVHAEDPRNSDRLRFTPSWHQVEHFASEKPFDLVIMAFVLHDDFLPYETLNMIRQVIRAGGRIGIIDLSTWDLPNLCKALQKSLISPTVHDNRLDPAKIYKMGEFLGCRVVNPKIDSLKISFPSPDFIDQYFDIFGIYLGMDLPIGLNSKDITRNRQIVQNSLQKLAYPFDDYRTFISCLMETGN